MQSSLAGQVSRYLLAGGAATVGHYTTLILLVEAGALDPVPAALAAFLVGGTISYTLNRRITFRSTRPHREAAPTFIAVAGVGFLMTGLLMDLLVNRLQLPYLPAQLLTTGLVMVWTFAASKFWTFRELPKPPG